MHTKSTKTKTKRNIMNSQ